MSSSEVWNVRISLGENWWEKNRSLNNLLYGHQYDAKMYATHYRHCI